MINRPLRKICEAPNWLHLIKATISHAKSYHWVSWLCICNNLPFTVENLYYLSCPPWFAIENHLQKVQTQSTVSLLQVRRVQYKNQPRIAYDLQYFRIFPWSFIRSKASSLICTRAGTSEKFRQLTTLSAQCVRLGFKKNAFVNRKKNKKSWSHNVPGINYFK